MRVDMTNFECIDKEIVHFQFSYRRQSLFSKFVLSILPKHKSKEEELINK